MKVTDYLTGSKTNPYAGDTKVTDQETRNKTQTEQAPETTTGDTVRLSDRSRQIARVQELVRAAPESRAEKVANIKAQVEAGTYNVQGAKVADKILSTHLSETI
ncbi:MAG: flagellar biosynthesis anti-sigma factor FlgM [Deltaproteobacteria bacterium]|nr:flagellar biosynthesis anti-sigma factor FlgM [Deltaproteobacteria bacterium]